MKRRVVSLGLVLALLSMATLAPAGNAQSQAGANGVSVPVAGTFAGNGKFTGTFHLQRFAEKDGGVVAVGTISGTATRPNGEVVTTGLQTVALPVTLSSGAAAAVPAGERSPSGTVKFMKASYDAAGPVSTASGTPAAAQASCEILRLSIGAINLNLLGLQVSLSPILLVITANPAGGLLGQLLCAIANLLNPPGPLTQLIALLNQLLALLNSL